LTSNLGSQFFVDIDDEDENLSAISSAHSKVLDAVKGHFRPEFLNRLDEIIIFNKLNRSNMDKIVEVQFTRLANRLKSLNILLELDNLALHYLASKGYDSQYGARPLKRVIQREIENILANKILQGEIKDGDKVKILYHEQSLKFAIDK
jgi:ATP-dependent Clp protease ATP-binding subunit ClpB